MEVCKAQSSDTLKLSPDDEIEGEIVYLQSRLLDGVVSMKQRYGKFFVMYIIIPYAAVQEDFGCCQHY